MEEARKPATSASAATTGVGKSHFQSTVGEQGFHQSSSTGHTTRPGRLYQNTSAQRREYDLRQASVLPARDTRGYGISLVVQASQSPQEEWDDANEDLFSILFIYNEINTQCLSNQYSKRHSIALRDRKKASLWYVLFQKRAAE